MIERIVSKRRKEMESGKERKDLLQILQDAHDAHPEEFMTQHVYEEMLKSGPN